MGDFGEYVASAFENLTPNINGIYMDAISYTISDWINTQRALTGSAGAGAMILPGAHVPALAADIIFLMNRMSVCCYGIGAIKGYHSVHDNILEEDFAIVLAYWAGDQEVKSMMTGKVATDLAVKVGGKVGVKLIAKTIAKAGTILVGKKLGSKVAVKVGAKFAGKFAAKLGAGFIPILGAAVGAGINVWFVSGISAAAKEYYTDKCKIYNDIELGH